MTNVGYGQGRVIDVNSSPILKLMGTAVALLVIFILLVASAKKVDAGHVGVLTLFGRVTGEVLPEGLHFVNPFKVDHEMSIRVREKKESASVPSSEGLVMSLDTSLIFRLNPDKAAEVYQKIGPGYDETIVEPTLRAAIREATASHTANALYTGEREKVARQIFDDLASTLTPRGIEVQNVFLRDIQLPAALRASIEAKQQAEQESLAMSFRLQKERQEAERKRIEAEGIRDFQRTVTQGISDQLLTWKGIEATEKLADSKNTKIVVIGSQKTGLPLILGQ
jgi:prohibitin 1